MSTEKYIDEVLEMPSNMPLFNYHVNFKNLRSLIEDIDVKTNYLQEELANAKAELQTKLPSQQFLGLEAILNKSFVLGAQAQKFAQQSEDSQQKAIRKQLRQMSHTEQYAWKMARLKEILEYLINLSKSNQQKIKQDDHRHQLAIDTAFRRIEEKVESSLASMTKNINLYFTDTNSKLSTLQTDLNQHKRITDASFEDIKRDVNGKVSTSKLQAALKGINERVKAQMQADIQDDNMKRLAVSNQLATKLQEHMKDVDAKNKATKNLVKQLTDRIGKSMPLNTFQVQKHKIYEKLSQYKNKIEDLGRGRQDFVDFRKNFYQINERIKKDIVGVQDDLKKLRQKGSQFSKMEDIGNTLKSLDPHLICQLGSEVKLHEKEIGKLQKQITYLQNEMESVRDSHFQPPQINTGQNSEMISKIIKQYMTNLDFEGRMKRAEKEIHDIAKKNDGVNQLQKKIFMLSKEMDIGLIMKQIKRKADEENTRRDTKIMDAKIQKLFEFYKQIRREIQVLSKVSKGGMNQEGNQSASLTTKKLYSSNCLSCTPQLRSVSGRNLRTSKANKTLDDSIQYRKQSLYVRKNH